MGKSCKSNPISMKLRQLSEMWQLLIYDTGAVACGKRVYYNNNMQIYTAFRVLIN
jgi:hypothetical protein